MYCVSGTVLDLGDTAVNKMWSLASGSLLFNERNIKQVITELTI